MRALRTAALAATALMCAASAHAATFTFAEAEPNDTIAQAQLLNFSLGNSPDQTAFVQIFGSVAGEGTGIVDWYRFNIQGAGTTILYRTLDVVVPRLNNDSTYLPWVIVDSAGRTIDTATFRTQTGGTYYLGIGNVPGATTYRADLLIAGVPEPTTWAMMLTGFALTGYALRRRRARVAFA